MGGWAEPLAVALWSAFALFGDCGDCKPAKLCPAHAKVEADTLKSEKAAFQSPDAAARCKALERAAATTEAHANAPTKEMTHFVATGLADPSLRVRSAAAKLLASGQNADEAIKALTKAAADAGKLLAQGGSKTLASKNPTEGEPTVQACATEVFQALAHYRDDRAVEALADVLRKLPYDQRFAPHAHAIVEGLATLGARNGLDAIIEIIRQYEGYGTGKPYHESLVQMCTAKHLANPPDFKGTGTAAAWQDFFDKHSKELPAKLGKLDSTP